MNAELSAETEETIKTAKNWMMHGAAEYIRGHKLTPTNEQFEEIVTRMKESFPAIFAQAREDAKAALDCGMRDVAVATFKGSFTLAGVVITRVALNIN